MVIKDEGGVLLSEVVEDDGTVLSRQGVVYREAQCGNDSLIHREQLNREGAILAIGST